MSVLLSTLIDQKASELLLAGSIGVIPTDTLYGLVCCAANQKAVERLYGIKSRERQPGTIIASSVEQLVSLGLKARYMKPIQHYWPGAVSVVIPCAFDLPYLHQGVGSLAVRVVASKDLKHLLDLTGPLLTSSANQPGEPPANTITEAQEYFGKNIDFYIDGGDLSNRQPSTLIRVVDDAVEILRAGTVKINEKGEIL